MILKNNKYKENHDSRKSHLVIMILQIYSGNIIINNFVEGGEGDFQLRNEVLRRVLLGST